MKTGHANLPLHGGKAPQWLFQRMKLLAREIVIHLVSEFSPEEVLRRLSDPFWFQAFGCTLGFDWHSSGVTTTVCGAVKQGIRGLESDLGLWAAGGKGATSRKTPSEIELACDRMSREAAPLVYASKTAAKVDSAAVQDGYTLYHHGFSFAHGGKEGFPYPVDTETYDKTIDVMRNALNRASVDRSEKIQAFRRLAEFTSRAHA